MSDRTVKVTVQDAALPKPASEVIYPYGATAPQANSGAGTPGTSLAVSREDHAHPGIDFTALDTEGVIEIDPAILQPDIEAIDGDLGVSPTLPRADHRHPLRAATTLAYGATRYATKAEGLAGTETARTVTPDVMAHSAQLDTPRVAIVTGTGDALILTTAPVQTTLANGMDVKFTPGALNTTTVPTINYNGTGPKVVTKNNNDALIIGELVPGVPCRVQYSLALDSWVLVQGALVAVVPEITTTSTTALTVQQSGTVTFTADANTFLRSGQFISVASQAAPDNYMYGVVTAYNAGTGVTDLLVLHARGVGYAGASWLVSLSGAPGPTPVASGIFTVASQVLLGG